MRTIVLPGVITILLLFTFTLSGEETESGIKILRVGSFHGNEVDAVSGEVWFGLYHSEDDFKLIRSEISVEQRYDGIMDNREGPYTGKRVTTDQPAEPIILIKGLEKMTEGPVKSLFSGRKFIYPAEFMSLKFAAKDYYSFHAFGEVIDRMGGALLKNYTIKFSHMGKSRIIASFERLGVDGLPVLLWAGDLDRDGKLDFLMDLTNHYNVTLYSLFLSSAAEGDELVKLVSQFRNIGC